MPVIPPEILEWRQRTGADLWDEMWEGVLHMPPMPNWDHQDLEWALEAWLRAHWAPRQRGKVAHNVNLARPGGWPKDYRIPDLVLLTPERFHINRNEYLEGAPDVVVEIRSPGDETYEKLTFYAALEVPEVWVIDRDTKLPQVFSLQGQGYQQLPGDERGWVQSPHTGVLLRREPEDRLGLRLLDDPASAEVLPLPQPPDQEESSPEPDQ